MANVGEYETGTLVRARDAKQSETKRYPAKVVDVAKRKPSGGGRPTWHYLVHYDGWNKRFDTWLPVRPKRGALSTPARRAPRALTLVCATRRARTSSP